VVVIYREGIFFVEFVVAVVRVDAVNVTIKNPRIG
jgi:hypothetical protein